MTDATIDQSYAQSYEQKQEQTYEQTYARWSAGLDAAGPARRSWLWQQGSQAMQLRHTAEAVAEMAKSAGRAEEHSYQAAKKVYRAASGSGHQSIAEWALRHFTEYDRCRLTAELAAEMAKSAYRAEEIRYRAAKGAYAAAYNSGRYVAARQVLLGLSGRDRARLAAELAAERERSQSTKGQSAKGLSAKGR